MMKKLYYQFKKDFNKKVYSSPLFKHYLNMPAVQDYYQPRVKDGRRPFVNEADEVVIDYIASMTDDYFVDVFKYTFPDDSLNQAIQYVGYFDDRYIKNEGL
jgi:dGTPase